MAGDKTSKSELDQSQENTLAGRFAWTLDTVFQGSQIAMARALNCSQAIISRIMRGKQSPSPALVHTLAEHPYMNRVWVLTGEGEPLVPQGSESLPIKQGVHKYDAALPIAKRLLQGRPYEDPLELEDELYPVSRQLYRDSRYWFRVTNKHRLASGVASPVVPGSMLLFEPDPRGVPVLQKGEFCLAVFRESSKELSVSLARFNASGQGQTQLKTFAGISKCVSEAPKSSRRRSITLLNESRSPAGSSGTKQVRDRYTTVEEVPLAVAVCMCSNFRSLCAGLASGN